MFGTAHDIDDYLARLQFELRRVPLDEVRRLGDWLFDAYRAGSNVFIIGNGGSACTASHLAEDLGKNIMLVADLHDSQKRRLRVLSLTDNVGWLTAIANDVGYDQVFVQQLMHYGNRGDLLIAVSASGNSPNVLAAVRWANAHGLLTFGISGYDGGALKLIQQAGIHVPVNDMGMAEGIHLCIGHWLIDDLHARVNELGRYSVASGTMDGRKIVGGEDAPRGGLAAAAPLNAS